LGHVLGLDHVPDSSAVMCACDNGTVRSLADVDVAGITQLYPRHPAKPAKRRDPSTSFRVIATMKTPIPTGTALWTVPEPGGLNARGDVSLRPTLRLIAIRPETVSMSAISFSAAAPSDKASFSPGARRSSRSRAHRNPNHRDTGRKPSFFLALSVLPF
jgi:hypothetical protein